MTGRESRRGDPRRTGRTRAASPKGETAGPQPPPSAPPTWRAPRALPLAVAALGLLVPLVMLAMARARGWGISFCVSRNAAASSSVNNGEVEPVVTGSPGK